MLLSVWRFLAILTFGSEAKIGFRPSTFPLDLVADKPALVLSTINCRSNWARAAKMLNIKSPEAVVVSMTPSCSDLKPIPALLQKIQMWYEITKEHHIKRRIYE